MAHYADESQNAIGRASQITIPSSPVTKKKVEEMVDATRARRRFQGRSFNKQVLHNCLILGIYDVEAKRDLDPEEVENRGLLAVVVDRGANELAALIAATEAAFAPAGARAAVAGRDDAEEKEVDEVPPPKAAHRKAPGLFIPSGFLSPRRDRRDDGAQQEKHSAVRNPIP